MVVIGTNAVTTNGGNSTNAGIKSYDAHMYGVGIVNHSSYWILCILCILFKVTTKKNKNDSTTRSSDCYCTASNKDDVIRYRKML